MVKSFSVFSGGITSERVSRFRIGFSLNNLSRLWGVKAVSSCLIPGLWVIRAGE